MENTPYIVAIDSDGCALDAMEIKHRQCFTPAIIETWQLQSIATELTDIALRINLYSRDRGINRFLALAKLFEQLRDVLPESKRARFPSTESIQQWIKNSPALSEGALEDALQTRGDPHLEKVLHWTRDVNRRVAQLPHPPAFPHVAEFLQELSQHRVPAYVVSSATRDIIHKEWQAAGIAATIEKFYGQEDGSKAYVLNQIKTHHGKASQILMIGDAPGDSEAAQQSASLFYPIIPGQEEQSWQIAHQNLIKAIAQNTLDKATLKTRENQFWQVLNGG